MTSKWLSDLSVLKHSSLKSLVFCLYFFLVEYSWALTYWLFLHNTGVLIFAFKVRIIFECFAFSEYCNCNAQFSVGPTVWILLFIVCLSKNGSHTFIQRCAETLHWGGGVSIIWPTLHFLKYWGPLRPYKHIAVFIIWVVYNHMKFNQLSERKIVEPLILVKVVLAILQAKSCFRTLYLGIGYIESLHIFSFANDIEYMTGCRPNVFWLCCWKYISPIALIVVFIASCVKLSSKAPTYSAFVGCTQVH